MDSQSQLSVLESENSGIKNSSQTTPNLIDIINIIADRVDPLLKIVTTMAERMLKSKETEVRYRTRMAWVAVIIVTFIVGVAGFLTYVGKVDGTTFGFLLGLIVGYVLTFIRDSINKPADE
jgi:uncharacterized membrane protein